MPKRWFDLKLLCSVVYINHFHSMYNHFDNAKLFSYLTVDLSIKYFVFLHFFFLIFPIYWEHGCFMMNVIREVYLGVSLPRNDYKMKNRIFVEFETRIDCRIIFGKLIANTWNVESIIFLIWIFSN